VALVVTDLGVAGIRAWWDRHSLTGSVVSNLLVVAVTALIVDEVVARRQRRQRAVSVAVQGLIVYGQTRRAYDGISGAGSEPTTAGDSEEPHPGAREELRALAAMVLTASPNLFDDPEARRFLEEVERLSVSMVRAVSAPAGTAAPRNGPEAMTAQMAQVELSVRPLLARIPPADRSLLEGPEEG